jgi:succinate-semialdehyde dehydrogenase/glutarate-semialdehyde dehydrogenase
MAAAATVIRGVNPATGEVTAEHAAHTPEEIDAAVGAAHAAHRAWRELGFAERAAVLHAVAAALRRDRDGLARLITTEMGKPIGESEAELDKCAWGCEFYADHAAEFLAEREIASTAERSFVTYQPLGVVLAIMPWNFPFWQVLRFAAPAPMAATPRCSSTRPTSRAVRSPSRACSATPERPTGCSAGAHVGAATGRAIKKSVLELGGSDPFVVLEDADGPAVAGFAAKSRFLNAGQSCISAKRFIVVDELAEEFERAFAGAVERLRVGDPLGRGGRLHPHRRRPARAPRLLLRPDGARRRDARDARVPGGDLRTRRGGHPCARRGARDRAGQRHAVRPRSERLDARRRPGRPRRPADRVRRSVRQRRRAPAPAAE